MKKPIAIAFADLHVEDWKHFSENHNRLNATMGFLRAISTYAFNHQLPILFPGDWFHNPKSLENIVIGNMYSYYKDLFEDKGIDVYAISGNHDLCEKNYLDQRSPSHLHGFNHIFKTFNLVDFMGYKTDDFNVYGIPYINGNRDYEKIVKGIELYKNDKPNILLVHTDLHGAKEPDGREVGSAENIPLRLDKFFGKFDLVLSGHIHKPQKITNKVYMLGAVNHQKISDAGCDMGWWLVYDDLSMEFYKAPNLPEYIYINEEEESPNDGNFYIKIPKKTEEPIFDEGITLSNRDTSSTLAKKYLKQKGIKNKIKKHFLINLLKSVNHG